MAWIEFQEKDPIAFNTTEEKQTLTISFMNLSTQHNMNVSKNGKIATTISPQKTMTVIVILEPGQMIVTDQDGKYMVH